MVEIGQADTIKKRLNLLLSKGISLEYIELFFPEVAELANRLSGSFAFERIQNLTRNLMLVETLNELNQLTDMFNTVSVKTFEGKPVCVEGDNIEIIELELFLYCIEDLRVDFGKGTIINHPNIRADRIKSYVDFLE